MQRGTHEFRLRCAGNPCFAHGPRRGTTAWTYDAAGRVLRTRDALGATWRYGYTTQAGSLPSQDPPERRSPTRTTANGSVVAESVGWTDGALRLRWRGAHGTVDAGAGAKLALAYDARRNLARVTDAMGRADGNGV